MAKTQIQPTDSDKLFAALSYVWVLFVFPLVLGHHKPFVYRHAKQGMALFIFEFVIMSIAWVPLFGWIVGFFGWLFAVIVSLLGIGHALAGQPFKVPFLSRYVGN